jgi:hypothetical protein
MGVRVERSDPRAAGMTGVNGTIRLRIEAISQESLA